METNANSLLHLSCLKKKTMIENYSQLNFYLPIFLKFGMIFPSTFIFTVIANHSVKLLCCCKWLIRWIAGGATTIIMKDPISLKM